VSAAGGSARGGRATRAALGRKATLGSAEVMGCGGKLGQKEKRRVEEIKEKLFILKKHSNKSLNSNTQNNAPACMQQGIPIFHY
jgi:hypothetical protein